MAELSEKQINLMNLTSSSQCHFLYSTLFIQVQLHLLSEEVGDNSRLTDILKHETFLVKLW